MFKVEDIVKRVSAPVDYAGASNTPIGEARKIIPNSYPLSEARKIIPNSYPLSEASKIAEETTELVEAAAKLRLLEQLEARVQRDEALLRQALTALEQIARDLPWELTGLNHIREKE